MNQTEMLREMCHEVLAEADVRAICKNRGLPNQGASSRPMLESLFLSDAGVAVAMHTLDRTEIALLHLLRSQDKPVDVAFFRRLNPPQSKAWSYGTFSQRFQGVFSRVKDRLVRGGILLLALGPESLTKKTKMERWQFALPVQFARHLPPLVESKRLSGEGDWRSDAAREKLKTAVRQGADREPNNDRVEIVDDELCWGGQPFRSDRLVQWRKLQWQAETAPAKHQKQADPYTLPPAEAVLRILAGLEAGLWSDAAALAVPLEIFCGFQVDAAMVCESGWRWGFLARQEAESRMWYRLAPAAAADAPPDRYLAVRGDEGVAVDLDAVPFDALETLVRMSDQRPLPGGRPLLLVTPNLVKFGRTADTVAALPLADWLQKNAPAFHQAFETVRQRRGKTILHENLSVARVGDLNLKVALEKALGSRIVVLGEEFIAFPSGAVAEVKRLVAQMGHVVKEVAPHEG
ncbi:MAG: hypothetical protein JO139_03485 [Alphaproteobacteria bacterium]|nr:hypothetical protein [Alphaproteobacteria bacterium]